MTTDINLYKINNHKRLIKDLNDENYSENKLKKENNEVSSDFEFTLYYLDNNKITPMPWKWVLTLFDINSNIITARPRAILIIKKDNEYYGASFGYSFHILEKHSDLKWSLDFAERMDYDAVKSVGIVSPNSLINRKIYNFFNYNYLDAESGDALNKISTILELNNNISSYLSDHIMIGNSIKFKIKEHDLKNIADLINYIESIMKREAKNPIPRLKECKNRTIKSKLNKKLIQKINEDILSENKYPIINIAEFKVIGYSHVFLNHEFNDFIFGLKNKKDSYSSLTVENVYDFIKNKHLENENILDLKIQMFNKDIAPYYKLKDLIMYSDDEYIFNEGKWYEYNSIYLKHIHESLNDIPIYHDKNYDFKDKEAYNKTRDDLKSKVDLGNFNYFENNFNNYVTFKEENFICLDRKMYKINKHKLEFADLVDTNTKTMYAVKVGKATSNLAYVVDQSLMSLKLLDDGEVEDWKKDDIKNVGLWIIFERSTDIPLNNNRLTWSKINMLILKNKIVDWKRQVQLSGRNPVININYKYAKGGKN